MRSWRLLFILAWLLAACGGATPTPDSSPLPTVSAVSNQPSEPPVEAGSVTETPAQLPSSAPTPTDSTLTEFNILWPEDDTVVNEPEVEVVGEGEPETVVTLGDEIVVIDETGMFSVTLPLNEGLNEIEIVASDLEGNEVSFTLEVTYDPES